jgi:uncharacterized paraquat-inducible protein A
MRVPVYVARVRGIERWYMILAPGIGPLGLPELVILMFLALPIVAVVVIVVANSGKSRQTTWAPPPSSPPSAASPTAPSTARFCAQCGRARQPQEAFCPACGTRFT